MNFIRKAYRLDNFNFTVREGGAGREAEAFGNGGHRLGHFGTVDEFLPLDARCRVVVHLVVPLAAHLVKL